PLGAHEVEIGPGVDASVAKVAVEGPRVPEAVVEIPEAAAVPAEVLGGDGGVLPAGVVVGLARRPGRGGQPGLPDLPEAAGPGRVVDERHGPGRVGVTPEAFGQSQGPGIRFGGGVPAQL